MAQHLTIARPYARAIFAEAQLQKSIDAWSLVLQALALITKDNEVEALLNNPNISSEKWFEFYSAACETIAENELSKIQKQFDNFLRLIIENRRLFVLPDINVVFHRLLAEQQGVTEVVATSAYPLSEDQCSELTKALEKRFDTKIELKTKLDKELIGGVLMRSQNWVLDASIKGQLQQFKQTLLGLGG